MTNNNKNSLDWVGNTTQFVDKITEYPFVAMEAVMNRKPPAVVQGHPLPPAYHYLYFLARDLQNTLAHDGHTKKGDFLPPVELPRRMWAGGRLTFHGPLLVGSEATKKSTIIDVTEKSGRSGDLVFVTVKHEITAGGPILLTEEHDIVYREAARPDAPAPTQVQAPTNAKWQEEITADPVLLFRYSALTFNGHRIHYDRKYCREEEGYKGLIVHGPLQGTLLMDLCVRKANGRKLKRFDFRNMAPIFDIAPFTINAKPVDDNRWDLWVAGPDNELALKATAEFE